MLVLPESEATGFSPGAEPAVRPGALSAPRPCSAIRGWEVSFDGSEDGAEVKRREEGGVARRSGRGRGVLWASCLRCFPLACWPPGVLE